MVTVISTDMGAGIGISIGIGIRIGIDFKDIRPIFSDPLSGRFVTEFCILDRKSRKDRNSFVFRKTQKLWGHELSPYFLREAQ